MTPIQHRFSSGSGAEIRQSAQDLLNLSSLGHLMERRHLVKVLAHPGTKTQMSGLVQRFFWTTLAKDCKVRAKTHGGLSDLWNGARY